MPRRTMLSSRAMPRAPDCEKKPSRPRSGISGESDAFSETSGSVLSRPNELGPMTRIPLAWALLDESLLSRAALLAGLREAGRHHHQAAHALGPAVGNDRIDLLGRDGDDGEVHLARGCLRTVG